MKIPVGYWTFHSLGGHLISIYSVCSGRNGIKHWSLCIRLFSLIQIMFVKQRWGISLLSSALSGCHSGCPVSRSTPAPSCLHIWPHSLPGCGSALFSCRGFGSWWLTQTPRQRLRMIWGLQKQSSLFLTCSGSLPALSDWSFKPAYKNLTTTTVEEIMTW